MSDIKDEDEPARNLPAVQPVGYCNPPAEHRFKKGRSGNPNGRPSRVRNKPKPLDPANEPTATMILEEAYRPVTIREGDRVIELPAIQAVMRAMGVSAMKGNRLAQKTLADIVQKIESARNAERLEIVDNALTYKTKWDEEIERCRAAGLPEPKPIPHPDDIIIDARRMEVRTEGPMTKEEKAAYDERLARRTEAQSEVNYYADQYRRARDPKRKARWLEDWHFEQRIFDLINDSMPKRYKVKLENRSRAPGGSKEGRTLREFAEDRKRAKAKQRYRDWIED